MTGSQSSDPTFDLELESNPDLELENIQIIIPDLNTSSMTGSLTQLRL